MSRIYVVEQMFVCESRILRPSFAGRAAAKLRPLAGLWPEPTRRGLLVLGTSELPLDAAETLLQAVFGDAVRAGPRHVCHLRRPRMQPIMDVFVRVAPTHVPAVIEDLHRRQALLRVSTGSERSWLVRAEAPMSVLLGYGRDVSAETDGSADHWITFNRWEPPEIARPRVNGTPARTFPVPAMA